MKYENVKLTLNSCYLCTWFWESAKMREFLIFFFKFDNFLLTFLTNCFYRTVENSLNNMIIIEKIYVDNECSVIMLNLSAAPWMVQRHYGSRDCRPLRELRFSNQVNLWHSKRFVFNSFNLLAGNQFLKLSVFLRQIGKISEIFYS